MNKSNNTISSKNLVLFTPLFSFNSDFQEIKLNDNLLICHPSFDELNVYEQDALLDIFQYSSISLPTFVIRSNILTPISSNSLYESQTAQWNCLKALRLLKSENIVIGTQYLCSLSPFGLVTVLTRYRNTIYGDESNIYVLRYNEIDRFNEIYNAINNINSKNLLWLNSAINRFYFSFQQGLLNSPIDITIGLEALYLANDTELSYKLAMRAAYLLGNTSEEINDIYSLITSAYKVRSKLVHGMNIKDEIKLKSGDSISITDLMQNTRNILRESILKFLDLSKRFTHEQLTSSLLDDNILSQGQILNHH